MHMAISNNAANYFIHKDKILKALMSYVKNGLGIKSSRLLQIKDMICKKYH